MKNLLFILLILLIGIDDNIAQQQQHIPWPSLADSPWPVLRGDMQATGRSKYIGPRTNNIIWIKDMPLGVLYGPAIGYDDVLYMGTRAVSQDTVNYFYAVDKYGNRLWQFPTISHFPNNGGPILRNDSTISFFSRNNNFYNINSDGSLKWKFTPISANLWPYWPLAKNGDIYLSVPDSLVIISDDGSFQRVYIPGISPPMTFSAGGDTIFFITGGFNLRPGALNAADLNGNIHWSYNFTTTNWGIPLVDNSNRVYLFGTGPDDDGRHFYSFNSDGSLNWKYPIMGYRGFASATIDKHGNLIFIATLSVNAMPVEHLISLDYYGNLNWTTPFEGDWWDHYINSGLVCDAEGKIYCGSSNGGYFYCFDNDGTLLWTLDIGEYQYDSCPAIGSDGTLYIGTHLSSLFANHTQNLIAIRDTGTVSVDEPLPVVDQYALYQNYPNPFNPATTIEYAVRERTNVKLTVFNIMGEEIRTLINEEKIAGHYSITFNGVDLPSGVYFYELLTDKTRMIKKMILLR